MNQYLEIGKVINKRGICGEMKLECYCDSPDVVKNVKQLYLDKDAKQKCVVVSVKDYKGYIYLRLENITTPEQADKMRGKTLYADRNELNVEKDSIFIADLIGLTVKDADNGKVYGKVASVENYGASNIYTVNDGKNTYLMPETNDIIVKILLDDCILVRPIPGIFDSAEEIR